MTIRIILLSFIITLATGSLVLYYYIHNLDEKYSNLINKGTDQLKIIQGLTFDSNRSYILLFMALSTSDTNKTSSFTRERNIITERNSYILDSLFTVADNEVLRDRITKVMESRILYRRKSEEIFNLSVTNKQVAINLFREELDPLFKSYQGGIKELFLDQQNLISSNSNSLSSNVQWKANVTLILSLISPIFLIIIIIITITVLIYSLFKDWMRERI